MINKKILTFIFIGFVILLFYFTLSGKFNTSVFQSNDTDISKRNIIQQVKKNQSALFALVDSIRKGIDTSFYAEYRAKEDRFQLYYIYNDTIGDFFSNENYLIKNSLSIAGQLGIRRVWKFTSENFYRFQLNRNSYLTATLFLLEPNQKEFSSPKIRVLSEYPIIIDENKVEVMSESFLFKLNDKELVLFHNHDAS